MRVWQRLFDGDQSVVMAMVRIALEERSPDFQRIALEPGTPLLDQSQSTAKLLRVWLGRFVGEPEWLDSRTVQFYVNDDQTRRIPVSKFRPATSADLAGPLRKEVQELRDRIKRIQPRGRSEQKIVTLISERLESLLQLPAGAGSDGAIFRYQDAQGHWRLLWCWGYQRSESKIVRPTICPKPDCRRVYLVRQKDDVQCPACKTPMPVFRFPWKTVRRVAVVLLVIAGAAGWRYWSTLPRSILEGQVVWSGFGVPVAGAELRVESLDRAVQTDEQGRFRLERLPAGQWTVQVAAHGYLAWSGPQELLQSQPANLLVELIGDCVLSGRVVDAVSQHPLTDAQLQIEGTSETLRTDEQGLFRREGCRSGPARLTVSAPGYRSATQDIELAAGADVPMDLLLAGQGVLLGRVVAAADDRPLANVSIRLDECGQQTHTDQDGWYAFRQAPTGAQTVVVELDEYATLREEHEIAAGREGQASFKLAGAAKVTGNVVRAADDSPMNGAVVTVAGTKFRATTDDDGEFELKGVMTGKSQIEVTAKGYSTERFDVELAATEPAVISAKLRGVATIAGQVTDELTKLPVAESVVRLVGLPHQTKTDAEGNYRLPEIPGVPVKLDVRSNGYHPKMMEVRPTSEEVTALPLTLQGNAALTIQVQERWLKKPVADAKLGLGSTELEWAASDEGLFEIKGLRSGVKLEFQLQADGLSPQTVAVDLKPNAGNRVEIEMSGPASLSGRIVSAIDESPLSGASVKLEGTNHETASDAEGRFELKELRDGRGVFEVSAKDFTTQRRAERVSPDTKPIKVILGGNASLAGAVLDAATGLPVADVEVGLDQTVLKTRTDAEGIYRLTEAFPGSAKLVVRADGYPTLTKTVTLTAEEEIQQEVTLTGTATVSGEIYSDVGKPVPNAMVQLGETDHHVKTGSQGEFQMPQLRAVPVELTLRAPGLAAKRLSAELKEGEIHPLGRVIMDSSLTLRGKVLHAVTEEPIGTAKLSIAKLDLSTQTDAEGRFQFDELPAKEISIKLAAEGFIGEEITHTPGNEEETVPLVLCPVPRADELFIVLTWNGAIPDLDAHLFRQSGGKADAHVFVDQAMDDNLSLMKSNRNGPGPETIRIHPLKPGRYEYVVQLADPEPNEKDRQGLLPLLPKSTPTVKVYRPGQSSPKIYRAGRNKKATVWRPFGLEIVGPDKVNDHVYKAEHYGTILPPEIQRKPAPK